MISATLYEDTLEVRISGQDREDFFNYLALFREQVPPAQRIWNEYKKCFVVRNAKHFMHLDWVRQAFEMSQMQLKLF